MARLHVINTRLTDEYRRYDALWESYERISRELQEIETQLQVDVDDGATTRFVELYPQRCALIYQLEHMHNLLERLMAEAEKEEQTMQNHSARIKKLEPAQKQAETFLAAAKRRQEMEDMGASGMPDDAAAGSPVGLSVKSVYELDVVAAQGKTYGPSTVQETQEEDRDMATYRAFMAKCNARLAREKDIQDIYEQAILEAERRKEDAFEKLAETIKKINSEQSIRSQRRIEANEKKTMQRLKDIEMFRTTIMSNLEHGVVTTSNVYKTFREEDQKRLLNMYIRARKKHLAMTEKVAKDFANEMARRELQYHKNLAAAKKQAEEKRKSMAVDNRNANLITRTTGLKDPYEVLYQSTRPKHLRDPTSVVAKNVVPQAAGLGFTANSGKKVDLSHFKEYSAEEQDILGKSQTLTKAIRAHSPSRADPMSYLYKDPFYNLLPAADPITQETAPSLTNKPPSASKNSKSSPTQPAKGAKGADAKKEVKEMDFDAWPSSDDDNEVALGYDNVPPAPAETFLTAKSSKGSKQKLPVAKSLVSGASCTKIAIAKLATSSLGKIGTFNAPSITDTGKSSQSSRGDAPVFLSHPPAIIFFDYMPSQVQTCVIQITNVSPGLAAFKVDEIDALFLHLLSFKYVPGGSMTSGAKVPITITFTPPANEKECLRVIDTALTIRHQSGVLYVPITCYPRQMSVLISQNIDFARKLCSSSIALRSSSSANLAAQAKMLRSDLNGALMATIGKTLFSSMGPSCMQFNKEGNSELITLSTAPHGKSERSLYILNSGALPARATFRLDACALHNSLLGIRLPSARTKTRPTSGKRETITDFNAGACSPSRLSCSTRCPDRRISLDLGGLSANQSTTAYSTLSRLPHRAKSTVATFRAPNVPIDIVQAYLQTATRSDSPRVPCKIYSKTEIENRNQQIDEYEGSFSKRLDAILNRPASATSLTNPPPSSKSPNKGRQPSPKAGAAQKQQKAQKPTESEAVAESETPTITEDEARVIVLRELGPKPEKLDSPLMNEALSYVHLTITGEPENVTPLLQIAAPYIVVYKNKTFNLKAFMAQQRSEKLKTLLQENLTLVTEQLEQERAEYEKSKEAATAVAAKPDSRAPSAKGKKEPQTPLNQSQASAGDAAGTLSDPEFFKAEVDRRVKSKTNKEIIMWEQEYTVLDDLLEYEEHSNIKFSVSLPAESIIALPVIHMPLLFQLDVLLKVEISVRPNYAYLDRDSNSDGDCDTLQPDTCFTNFLFVNAYTLPSTVYAVRNEIDYLTCFYNSVYNAELQLRSTDANSRPITVFVPTLMRTICTTSVSESIICKTTGDLFIKVGLFCESKSVLMKVLSQVERYHDKVDYTDLARTISKREMPPTKDCPLESWADIAITSMDTYPATLPSIQLGGDICALKEQLKDEARQLDDLMQQKQELEAKLADLTKQRKAAEEALKGTEESKPTSATGTTRDKDTPKPATDKKAPAKGDKTQPPAMTQEGLQKLVLECEQLEAKLQTLNEQNLPILQGNITSTKSKLRDLSSIGGYITCSFNILVRVSGQPEPILVRVTANFTSSDLVVKLPYTRPQPETSLTHGKSVVMSQITKTMKTAGTVITRTNRTRAEDYVTMNGDLDLQDRSSINLGQIALWHTTNVPIYVKNTSALPQHVAIMSKQVPDISLVASPDNGVVLLYPGQEVRMNLGILPGMAKKFQIKCSVESEYGSAKYFTICATSMQPSLFCQSNLEVFKLSIADVIRIDQIFLRSTVNSTKKWSISPSFLKFMADNFGSLINIQPTAGVVEPQAMYRICATITTSPATVLRLISFLDDQHADEALGDPFEAKDVLRAASINNEENSRDVVQGSFTKESSSSHAGEPPAADSPKEEHALGTTPGTDIINYTTKKNQFLYIQRRHLDPAVLLAEEASMNSDSYSDEGELTLPKSDKTAALDTADKELDKKMVKKIKTKLFVDQHITINVPIIMDDTDAPFIVCPLNLLIQRPLIVISVVPDELCDKAEIGPDEAKIIEPLSLDSNSGDGGGGGGDAAASSKDSRPQTKQGQPSNTKEKAAPEPPAQAPPSRLVSKTTGVDAQTAYVTNLLRVEKIRLPFILEQNRSVVTISFGHVPLGCITTRSATIQVNDTLPMEELNSYYGDTFRFKRRFEEAFDTDIVMTSCLEEAYMTPDKPLTLRFQYSPRRTGYTEESIELISSSVNTCQRLNNLVFKLKGYGVKVALKVTLSQTSTLVQTDLPVPEWPGFTSADIIYTETPPIFIADISGSYSHTLELTLTNDQEYSFNYSVAHLDGGGTIMQNAATSEGTIMSNSNVPNKIFLDICNATKPGGEIAAAKIVSGDAKKLVLCRVFASRHPVAMYFGGPVINMTMQGTTYIYCGCAMGQPQAEFKHVSTSPQLADVVISPANGTVQPGKMAKIGLSVPKLTFSGSLSIQMEGHIGIKLACGGQERTVMLPVKVLLS